MLLCGDMAEVRSLTAPLIERLNIEVETLDTLEGIDTAKLPEGFAERASTLRLASAIAVEPPPVNLLPVEVTASRASRAGLRVVAAGTAAAIVLGAFLYARADATRVSAEQELEAVRREMSSLPAGGPSGTLAGPETERLQRAALLTLDAQGPSMARLLEAVANAAPPGVTLRSLRALPDGPDWRVGVDAFAAVRNQIVSRRAADQFLRALLESPVLGEPLGPPTLRDGPTGGVEIAASYRVRK